MNFNEVDKILVVQLRELGVTIDGFNNLLEKENFYLSCVFCLKRVLTPSETEQILPQLKSGVGSWKKQISQCKTLANTIKNKLNYRNELTFDNFLYPTELVVRQLLSFLIELFQRKMEREKKRRTVLRAQKKKSKSEQINDMIKRKFKDIYNESFTLDWSQQKVTTTPLESQLVYVPRPKILSHGKSGSNNNSVLNQNKNFSNLPVTIFEDNIASITLSLHEERDWEINGINSGLSRSEYFSQKKNKKLKFVNTLISRVIRKEKNDQGNFKSPHGRKILGDDSEDGDAFKRRVDFEGTKDKKISQDDKVDPMSEEAKKKRELEIQKYDSVISKLSNAIEKIVEKITIIRGSIKPLDESYEKESELSLNLTKEYALLRKTCNLYENKEENLKKLRKISSSSAKKLIKMAAEWERYRVPKITLIRKLKREILSQKDIFMKETERITLKKDEMRKFIEEIKAKQGEYKKYVDFYNSMEKDKNRDWYVQKILEIVRNIEAQNMQIEKVLFENRDVKDKISTATNRAQQKYREIEEKVFKKAKEAKRNIGTFSKELYGYFLEIHTLFEGMVKNINQEGIYLGKVRDYDKDIEDIMTRNDEVNTKKIEKDMKAIKDENVILVKQLKRIKERFSKF